MAEERRILIVEDDPHLRFVLRMVLEKGGYDLGEARNGVAALELIADGTPNSIVADARTPIMDGRELVGRLRSDPETARLSVVLLSGYPEIEKVVGASAVLAKAFEPADLLKTVRSPVGAD